MSDSESKPISNPEDKRKIKSALTDASDSMYRIAAERDNIKEIINTVSKDYNIPKKIVSKMVKTYHKESYDKERAEADDFENYYESIVGNTTTD